ncbi:FAD-dependent oxidoreductase [Oceanirhabdus sp. W0125-5]|uniref:FAD-dependent oxidoreductase n=1 Tax=Oceanirhabdus sp. W0125-5 TaxID=2999116 RepID=UPI0022F34119|nr:FAD-dependent oxidoreductase [Oceanirhabdus sp. W0125-5]WBW95228.1 FAD-dependent oxidoreductase [Oceanirhabdus sp. W0125-5]
MKAIIIGGGWAGAAAALSARKQGAEVHVYEKTDLLLGLGNIGGIIRNNGRYTAAEELIAMGCGELIELCDENAAHKTVDFPGHKHATLYNVNKIEPAVRNYLISLGINLHFVKRVSGVELKGKEIKGIYLHDGTYVEGDVFIETTGGTGPMGNCMRYGNGCSMCVLRCPSYGPRVSITEACGLEDIMGERADGEFGAFSGSCKLAKDTLSEKIQKELDEKGVSLVQIPKEDVNKDKLKIKVCQQYALDAFAENIILLDTGHAKLMTSYYPLDKLRKIKGLENAKYIDPYGGGKGNSIRYLSIARRKNDMRVMGIKNLFVGGEKSGLFVGHTEAICTGTLAGYNAVKYAKGEKMLILPRKTAIGDIIAYANYRMLKMKDHKTRYTFAGSVYFKRMEKLKLYTIDKDEIRKRIKDNGLENIFSER